MCRQDTQKFVKTTSVESRGDGGNLIVSIDLRAQLSAMRFALRRARWDFTPEQCFLRDAIFDLDAINLGDDNLGDYRAEIYEDRPIPVWCWQFDRIERGMSSNYGGFDDKRNRDLFIENWSQKCLRPWKRTLHAELEDNRMTYLED